VSDAAGGPLYVHVAGAVRRPGVYRLRDGDRVADAVERAGGPSRHASIDAVNLAAKLADGQQVVVPREAMPGNAAALVSPASGSGGSEVTATGAGATAAGGAAAATGPVDLNAATLQQLDTLDGVGPATAQKILDWRTEHGGFRSVDDLAQVPGIGAKRMAALRPKVRV
jgi:competence protein ComEA